MRLAFASLGLRDRASRVNDGDTNVSSIVFTTWVSDARTHHRAILAHLRSVARTVGKSDAADVAGQVVGPCFLSDEISCPQPVRQRAQAVAPPIAVRPASSQWLMR